MRNFTKHFFAGFSLLLVSGIAMAQKMQSQPQDKKQVAAAVKNPVNPFSKIDTRLTDRMENGKQVTAAADMQTPQLPEGASTVKATPSTKGNTENTLVNIKCVVGPDVINSITKAGGQIIYTSKEDNLIKANLPLDALKEVAAAANVKQITPSETSEMATAKAGTADKTAAQTPLRSNKNIVSESVLKQHQAKTQTITKTAAY
jgi:hypothetical protein